MGDRIKPESVIGMGQNMQSSMMLDFSVLNGLKFQGGVKSPRGPRR